VALDYDAKVRGLCDRAGLAPWLVDPGAGDFSERALDLARALLEDPLPQLQAAAVGRRTLLEALEGNAAALRRLNG